MSPHLSDEQRRELQEAFRPLIEDMHANPQDWIFDEFGRDPREIHLDLASSRDFTAFTIVQSTPQGPRMLTIDNIQNLKADRGNPYVARNPKDQYLAAAERAVGGMPRLRSRIRKGKLVRFRRKSHKRVIDPGPSPSSVIKQHARALRKMPKQAIAPDVLEKNRKEHGARSVDHRNALAHRSNAARRAKLASRRR